MSRPGCTINLHEADHHGGEDSSDKRDEQCGARAGGCRLDGCEHLVAVGVRVSQYSPHCFAVAPGHADTIYGLALACLVHASNGTAIIGHARWTIDRTGRWWHRHRRYLAGFAGIAAGTSRGECRDNGKQNEELRARHPLERKLVPE